MIQPVCRVCSGPVEAMTFRGSGYCCARCMAAGHRQGTIRVADFEGTDDERLAQAFEEARRRSGHQTLLFDGKREWRFDSRTHVFPTNLTLDGRGQSVTFDHGLPRVEPS